MKFLVAPDKFKGCLSAAHAAQCIAAGIRAVLPDAEIDQCPIADGGEGTVAALLAAKGGRLITRRVTGPLPEMKVDAAFAMLADNKTAVIEMSAASGLALLPMADRNPMHTTSFGTGELIVAAVSEGATKIILGLGGSSTVDAGIGCLQACGFTILTRDGQPGSITEPLCGGDLSNVLMVKHGRGEITAGIEIIAATDVMNPLLGPHGAAHVFGPQKGTAAADVEHLEANLRELAERVGVMPEAQHPGAGAAGGLGFAVLAFFRGRMVSGFDLIAEAIGLKDRIRASELCITGEGRLDSQSLVGKAAVGVGKLCQLQGVPCVALVGSVALTQHERDASGITACFSICNGPMPLECAMKDAARLLTQSASNCARLWLSCIDID